MFLGWFDDTPKKSSSAKLEEALARYLAKFGEQADLCLVSAEDAPCPGAEGVEVHAVGYVRPNHFWVGKAESLPVGAAQPV